MGALKKPDADCEIGILLELLNDVSVSNGLKNTLCDQRTVSRRSTEEGLSFLTKKLPLIAKALESGLESGQFICPTDFGKYKKTALPRFLKGLLSRIFDWNGYILTDVDIASIGEVRQICYLFYKVAVEFDQSQRCDAEEKFKRVDDALPTDLYRSDGTTLIFSKGTIDQLDSKHKFLDLVACEKADREVGKTLSLARDYVHKIFEHFNGEEIEPFHGPGIVATGETPDQKRVFSTHYRRLHDQYPYYRTFVINPAHLSDCRNHYFDRDIKEVGTNKVLFVPKDSRGPRTIACEPLEYQFVQQGLRTKIYEWIDRHPLTKGRINFTDQTINQELAKLGSYEPFIATVDLEDASDSVSMALVRYLFPKHVLKLLEATRTPFSELPSGEVVALKKYAAMGSALCFPVEAIVFYAIALACYSFYPSLFPFLYVYGDDIIVDREILPHLEDTFRAVGLKINTKKTFSKGSFRESCGKDYFRGFEVTPVKIRKRLRHWSSDLSSFVETVNNLYNHGFLKAADYLREKIRKYGIPFGYTDSPYLCFVSRFPLVYRGKMRWNKSLQFWERKVPMEIGSRYVSKPNSLRVVYREVDDTLVIRIDDVEEYGEYFRKLTTGWSPDFVRDVYAERRKRILKYGYVQCGR